MCQEATRRTIWQLTTSCLAEVATLAVPLADQAIGSMKRFGGDGSILDWATPPRLEPRVGKREKPKPLGDIGQFLPGSLVFGDKGRAALGPFLLQFGQLLKLEVDGAPYWLFNVTHLVACIDRARSEQRAGGTIGKEAFVESALPIVPAVFKDPITARARIYVNDGGKLALEEAAAQSGIRGLKFLRAGLAERAP